MNEETKKLPAFKQQIMDMLEESLTKEEFTQAFETVLKLVSDLKKSNEAEFSSIHKVMTSFADKLKNDTNFDLSDMRRNIMEHRKGELDRMLSEHSMKMSEVDEKMKSIRDGKDADEEAMIENIKTVVIPQIAEEVKNKVEKDLPQLGFPIRDGLELIKEEKDKLSIEAIKDLRKELDSLRKLTKSNVIGGGMIGRDFIKDYDLSSQLDGVTKTFNIPAVWNIVSVALESYPYGALRKNIDYTYTPQTITFTDTIDASTQLASGQACVLTIVT